MSEKFNPMTKGGYNLYHVVSAFQKYVRRGMEHEAMYMGTELLVSGYHKYAWYRMKVMASEDVGFGNPLACVQLESLHQTFNDFQKEKREGASQMVFCHAILILVRSEKSRIVDNLYCKYVDLRNMIYPVQIHDYCFDQFTDIGKAKGRGDQFFFDESGKINNIPAHMEEEELRIQDELEMMYKAKKNKEKIVLHNPNKELFE